jgi:hypothetical protein
MTQEEVSPIERFRRLRNADHYPCGVVVQFKHVRGTACFFQCYKSPWHKKRRRAFLGRGVTFTCPEVGKWASELYPDSTNFIPPA